MKTRTLLPVLLCLALQPVFSQVQEEIRLSNGLIIQNGVIYGRNNIINDPQAFSIIYNSFERPYAGLVSGKAPSGEEAAWAGISADEEGYFRSGKLRDGALYIEYESPVEKIMLLKASGHTMAFINGEPREGDHYDFNFSVHPVLIKKGLNHFYFTGGRFPRIKASLTEAVPELQIKKKDLTLPDLVIEEPGYKWGGVTIINAVNRYTEGLKIRCTTINNEIITELPGISELTSRRVNFKIPSPEGLEPGEQKIRIELLSRGGNLYDSYDFSIKIKHFEVNHDRTFISNIDGSVQYYSVTPGTKPVEEDQALFLSVHGAGVQARNQAWTYDAKDWGHIVAPTNRGPFGFAWEDWGRLDALEVLDEGRRLFQTRDDLTFLTGHSMGGHGTWYLGATYPDRFASIAPCAGYPDLLNYAMRQTKKDKPSDIEIMYLRAGNPSRTLKLARNYKHHGVYVYHGDSDPTVSVEQARLMRKVLGDFHPDFTYYEYPGGTHWYGDISMDWPPIFDFFKLHSIPGNNDVKKLEFHTANPGISASSHWITVIQQIIPFEISSVEANIEADSSLINIASVNISNLGLKISDMSIAFPLTIIIDEQKISVSELDTVDYLYLRRNEGKWEKASAPSLSEKGPHRYGGFKDAFRKNMVFVYGTGGNREENRWNYLKARFDAETFSYRGNGSVEVVSDRQFRRGDYSKRNIILYGNADNNHAWKILIPESPVIVYSDRIVIGDSVIRGDDLACYFIRPRKDSDDNSVGIIAGTGLNGIKATYPNQYFIAGTSFPDLTIFRLPTSNNGYKSVECAGFFGNDWSVEQGSFSWK